jgi:PAS domain S-box-containing protein
MDDLPETRSARPSNVDASLVDELEALRRELERQRALGSKDRGVLDAILEHSPHGIIVCDAGGKLILQNRAAERIWAGSATAERVEDWGKYRAFHPDGRPFEAQDWAMAKCLATGAVVDAEEFHIQRFDGTEGYLLGSSAPILSAEGQLEGGISVFADISGLRQSEARARVLQDDLGSKLRDLEEIASQASLLQSLTAAITRAETVHEIADIVTAQGRGLFGATGSLLYLIHAERRTLEVVSVAEVDAQRVDAYRSVSLDSPQALPDAIRSGEGRWFVSRDELVAAYPELGNVNIEGVLLEGLVVLPVRDTREVIGGIALTYYGTRPKLDHIRRDFFLTVASHCGLAIERARAFEAGRRALEAERHANARLEAQRRRLSVLSQAGETLSASLDSRHAVSELAKLVVPTLGAWCSIDEIAPDGSIRRLAVHHHDPEKVALAKRLHEKYPANPDAPHGVPQVLRTGQTEWAADIPDEMLVTGARDAEHLALVRALGLKSYAVVPIKSRDRVLGALSLVTEGERRLDEDDLAFAEELARRAALALENARLYEAAEAARAQLHGLFTHAPAAISIGQGREHRYELANEPYERLAGRQLVGRTLREAFPGEEGKHFVETIERVYDTGESFTAAELPLRVRSNGGAPSEEGFFNIVHQPTRDAEGRIDGVATFAFDVTAQVAARRHIEVLAADLSRSIKALEATNRELDQFAYAASHDLRAPLRAIGSLAEWLEEDLGPVLTADAVRKMDLLRGRVRRMEGLIQGILDFSRATRSLGGQREELDVNAVVAEVVDLLAPKPPAAVTVVTPLPRLFTERVPLQQVFMNLIGNALKHAGRQDAQVAVDVRDAGALWEFRVTDNGPGIAPEFQDRVWGIFQTLEARDRAENTGIGLAIVRKIAEARGARTWIESAAGEGATFAFTWPKDAERHS